MGKIVIMTHAPNQSLGDPSAASKLQRILYKKYGEIQEECYIEVVVEVLKQHEQPVRNLFTHDMPYKVIDDYDSTLGKTQLDKSIEDADLIICYPTPHFITPKVEQFLIDNKKPILLLSEYDFDFEHNFKKTGHLSTSIPGSPLLCSGLGKGSLGIFIDKTATSLQNLSSLHNSDISKFPVNFLDKNKELYFGYFNKSFRSLTIATPANFIAFAALVSRKRELDIVLPLQPNDASVKNDYKISVLSDSVFIQYLSAFNQIQLVYFPSETKLPIYLIYRKEGAHLVSSEVSKEEFEKQQNYSDKIIRVINPFPLHKESMMTLMNLSEPVNFITGDQSISEVLSLSKLPFYQAVPWKIKFYNALIDASRQYKILHNWLSAFTDESTTIELLAEYYKENADNLRFENDAFQAEIAETKNFEPIIFDYIQQTLKNSPEQLFTQLLQYIMEFPELYSESDDRHVFVDSLAKHVNYFLQKAASLEEKNNILNHLSSHLDSLGLMPHQKIALSIALRKTAPTLNVQLQPKDILSYLSNMLVLRLDILNEHGNPIFWSPVSPANPDTSSEEEEEEEQYSLQEKMLNIFTAFEGIHSADISLFSPDEKIEVLKKIMRCQAVYNEQARSLDYLELNKFLDSEVTPELLHQLVLFLFMTPCYSKHGEGAQFSSEKPNIFSQLGMSRDSLLEKLLTIPQAKAILFNLLFCNNEAITIKAADNTLMNELTLKALFFPPLPGNTYSFFNSSPNSNMSMYEKHFLVQLLDVDKTQECIVINTLESFLHDSQKLEQFYCCFQDTLPVYLKDFIKTIPNNVIEMTK